VVDSDSDGRMDVVGIGGRFLLVVMIGTPHSLHTHSRSSSYIYKVFQHLLQFLVVIRRMPPHPYICPLGPESGCCWYKRWVTVSTYD